MLRPVGILLLGALLLGAQTDRVRVWQDTVTFPTYREKPPDAIPPFDQFAIAGTGVHSVYPYTLRENMTDQKYDAPWRVLHLENQYLHCMVLPDLGGHLYTCRDKLSGASVFYANTAIKKSDVAPRGAWVAGGIETSFPVAHSRVTVSPVHFATANHALLALANRDRDGAAAIFQAENFPQENQPPEVRQAYAELWMRRLLAAAVPGKCQDVAAAIDNFAPKFGDLAEQLRIQFYFGLAESLCGDRKAAERRWSRVAKAKADATSADFAFPVLAASLVDPAGSQRTVETALESVRTGGGPSDKGLRLYAEGMLLRAAGRNEDAAARFREGAEDPSPFIRYLNGSAQYDPPLPR